jgi:hypothetical protein
MPPSRLSGTLSFMTARLSVHVPCPGPASNAGELTPAETDAKMVYHEKNGFRREPGKER